MRTIGKMVGLCLVTVFVIGMALAGSASAAWEQCSEGGSTTKYSEHQCLKAEGAGKWGWNEVTGTEEVRIKGSVRITDTKVPVVGKVSVECSFEAVAHVGPGERSRVNEVKTSAEQCRNVENCEKVEKAEARHLSWQVEAAKLEGKILAELTSTGSGGPGWSVTCKVLSISKEDECVTEAGKPENLILENKVTGSELLVLATFRKTRKAKCSVGGAESGEVAGSLAMSKANGWGLRIAASPPAACKVNKAEWIFCDAEGKAIQEEKVEGTGEASVIKTANITIECSVSKLNTGYLLWLPLFSGLETRTCSESKPAGCSVPTSFEGKMIGSLVGAVPGGPPEEEFVGEGKGEEIMSVELTGSGCSVKGVHALDGRQTCKYDATFETAQEVHEVKCNGEKSKLTFGGETAEFEHTIKDHLKSKAKWSIQLN